MSFDLKDHYDNPIEQAMLDLANIVRFNNGDAFDSDGEALFTMLVRGLYIYAEAWAESGGGSLADLVVTSEDLADPNRVSDPHATMFTLVGLALESMGDNIGCEIYPDYGRDTSGDS